MKFIKSIYIFSALLILLLSYAGCKEDELFPPLSGEEPRNIAQLTAETSSLSILSGALSRVNLDSTLSTTVTHTLFAPTNAALSGIDLAAMSDSTLNNFLLNHIRTTVDAEFTSTMETGYLTTLATGPDGNNLSLFINVTDEGISLNGMGSISDDLRDMGATNGVIHGISGILQPPTVADHVAANPGYSSLNAAIAQVSFAPTLQGTGPYTFFAPTNDAFEAFMAEVNGAFGWTALEDVPSEVLTELLRFHVVSGDNLLADDVDGETMTTLDDETFSVDGTTIDDPSYEDAVIQLTDIQGVNGVMHGINKVLLTEEVFQSILAATLDLVDRSTDRGYSTFVEAVEAAGLTSDLKTTNYTAFVPNNDAFVGLFAVSETFDALSDFDTPEEMELLADLIRYHLRTGELMASGLTNGLEIQTINGDTITVNINGEDIRLAPSLPGAIPSMVVANNIGATNGIIHAINRVLIPEALATDLGIPIDDGNSGLHPVGDPELVFFDWNGKDPWWGNVSAENEAALSLDGTSYGRANFQTGGTGWQDLFWRNDHSTFNGADMVGSNLSEYSLKFDINVLEPINDGMFRIRFHDADGVDAFYNWAPWDDSGEPFDTDGWITVEIPLSVLGVPDFSLVDAEFGMAFEGADVLLNFAIDNVRFDTPGNPNAGPDDVDDPELVFFDWSDKGPWWGNVNAENEVALSLDGSPYGRANFQTGGTGWQDLFWRNDASTFNGASTVGSNTAAYALKFDINVLEPINAGMFRIRFHDADGVDAFYNWQPWVDSGEAFSTDGWITVSIPCSVLGVPDFSLVDAEFGMAFEGADILLNFAIDNVRFEEM